MVILDSKIIHIYVYLHKLLYTPIQSHARTYICLFIRDRDRGMSRTLITARLSLFVWKVDMEPKIYSKRYYSLVLRNLFTDKGLNPSSFMFTLRPCRRVSVIPVQVFDYTDRVFLSSRSDFHKTGVKSIILCSFTYFCHYLKIRSNND